jgi:RHS repeat-associated protein
MTNGSGSLLLAQTFDPYGNPYMSTGTGDSAYGYGGEQTDHNGLVFLRARYYNPSQGRFLNTDPSRQERNPHQYAGSNPILHTDPSGLCRDDACHDLAKRLEREYQIFFYWPVRLDLPITNWNTLRWLANQQMPCLTIEETLNNGTYSSDYWELEELQAIESGLTKIKYAIGALATKNITRGGIFYRLGGDTKSEARYCHYGICDPTSQQTLNVWHLFEGAPYAVLVGEGFMDEILRQGEEYGAFVLTHELSHRVHYRLGGGIEDKMYRYHYNGGWPTKYARDAYNLMAPADAAEEYFAETLASYIWEKNGLVPPEQLNKLSNIPAYCWPICGLPFADKRNLEQWTYDEVIQRLDGSPF